MKNIQDTLMSQYANSPIICSLIAELNSCIDPSKCILDFYKLIWNVKSATGSGLDIWGRIVGVTREISLGVNSETFGFKTSSKSFYPFNSKTFSASGTGFSSYQLTDEKYRKLIMIKAAANIVYATATNINRFMRMIFPNQRCYYLITGHMKARYVFEFVPDVFERHIIFNLQILPRPCGVLLEYKFLPRKSVFGFSGSGFQPFNNGALI